MVSGSPNIRFITCTPCPAGFASAASGWDVAARALPGSTRFGNYGGYSAAANAIASHQCTPCTPNTHAAKPGQAACTLCPAGTSTPAEGAVDCTPCGPGTYSPTATDGCMSAPPGYFVNSTGATSYKPCPLGAYNPDMGSDGCDPCAAGSYANMVGSKICKVREREGVRVRGWTAPSPSLPLQPPPSPPHTQTCPGGTYSYSGSSFCAVTQRGSYTPSGASAPIPCPTGTYGDATRLTACKACPAGYYCPSAGIK